MTTQTRSTINTDRREILDKELSLWSKKGYRVLSRSTTAAQLSKPRPSPLLVSLVALLLVLGWLAFIGSITFTQAAVVLTIGAVLLASWHASRGEHLVYLTVDSNGEITQD